MPYPTYCYYEQAIGQTRYERNPTGQPDPNRIIEGHADFWISPQLPNQQHKKTIVFADPILCYESSPRQIEVLRIHLRQLLADDFKVYLWQRDDLCLLTKENLYDLKKAQVINDLSYSDREQLYLKAAQLKISRSSLLILSRPQLHALFQPEQQVLPDENKRMVSVFDYADSMQPRQPVYSGCPVNRFQLDFVTSIRLSDASEASKPLLGPSSLKTTLELKGFTDLSDLMQNRFFYQTPYVEEKVLFTEAHLATLKHLILKYSALYLCPALNMMPGLKRLTVEHINEYDVYQPITSKVCLEQIELLGTIDITAFLMPFLKTMSAVRVLHLGRIRYDEFNEYVNYTDVDLSELSLPQLEELTLDIEKETIVFWNAFLKCCPNLKRLTLIDSGNVFQLIDAFILNRLEEIELMLYDPLDSLPSYPNLKYVNCYRPDFKDKKGVLELERPIDSLEHLALNLSSNLIQAQQQANTLLRSYPSIQQLVLYNKLPACEISTLSIKELTLSLLDDYKGYIDAWLQKSHLLTTLQLSICTIYFKESLPFILPELKTLIIKNCEFQSDTFIHPVNYLFSLAPNLERLDYVDSCRIGYYYKESIPSLPLLKEAYFKLNWDVKSFILFLHSIPNIRFLDLSCSIIGDEPKELDFLPLLDELVEINLSATQLSENFFNVLVAAYSGKIKGTPQLVKSHPLIIVPSYIGNIDLRPKPSAFIDASTEDIKANFKVKRLFWPVKEGDLLPAINDYRIHVYNQLITQRQGAREPFLLQHASQDLQFIERPLQISDAQAQKARHYCSHQELQLQANQWHPLASLSPNEWVYDVQPLEGLSIRYSQRDSLYYVRSAQSGLLALQFNLAVFPAQDVHYSPKIMQCKKHCESFGSGALQLEPGLQYSGEEYVQLLWQQKKGACRHRAIAFLYEMQKINQACRVVTNQCHAFVEVLVEGTWFGMDLGGYAADLTIDEGFRTKPPAAIPMQKEKPTTDVKENPAVALPQNNKSLPIADKDVRIDNPYKTWFTTWNKQKKPVSTVKAYIHDLLTVQKNKLLIECTHNDLAEGLYYAFLTQSQALHKPLYYIEGPEALRCAGAYMQKQANGQGRLLKGPGGPLHDFILQHPQGLLLINYSAFNAEDLVRFNALLDNTRSADGTPLPDSLSIIGLLARERECMPGNDFYSRFDIQTDCPFDSDALPLPALPLVSRFDSNEAGNCFSVDFFNGQDWEKTWLGSWEPKAEGWYYKDSDLIRAVARGVKTIQLGNIPEHNERFMRALRTALMVQRLGEHSLEEITFTCSVGYNWPLIKECLYAREASLAVEQAYLVFNTQTMALLLQQYDVVDGHLCQSAGWIEAASAKVLHLLVTETLSADAWARIGFALRQHNKKAMVSLMPGVCLPDELAEYVTEPIIFPYVQNEHLALVQVEDRDACLASLSTPGMKIDISECTLSDLEYRIDVSMTQYDSQEPRMQWVKQRSAVLEALEQGQHVVLSGQWHEALVQQLTPMVLERWLQGGQGKLTLMVSKDTTFSGFTKQQLALSQDESYAQQQAKRRYAQAFPDRNPERAWEGLNTLTLSQSSDECSAQAFQQRRKNEVKTLLQFAPYVFLTGLSGVGKSTFVREVLGKEPDVRLFVHETDMIAWATCNESGKQSLLFLDEANLSNKQWSELEGLFYNPPSLFIDGRYYPLTSNHKVIFAGNPVHYGDERRLAPFFARHGNCIVFEPLPRSVLTESILFPLWGTLPQQQELSDEVLDVYELISRGSTKEILISPRELEMIALLTCAYLQRNPQADALTVGRYFIYQLTHHLVPTALKADYQQRVHPKADLPLNPLEEASYVLTPSRRQAVCLLDEFLALQQQRKEQSQWARGGVGGLLFEGEPGIGKTELVIERLIANGYKEGTMPHDVNGSCFYRMPVSLGLAEKKALLYQAFDEGAVVVIDEMNSSPMMERLLNDLLMGISPMGKPPKTPGFMIIATQNPITMAGRRAASTALERRMTKIELPEYPVEELRLILSKKYPEIPAERLHLCVDAYQEQRALAKRQKLEPAPTFRDLLRQCSRYYDHLIAPQTTLALHETSDEQMTFVSKPQEVESRPFWNNNSHVKSPEKHIEMPESMPSRQEAVLAGLKQYIERVEGHKKNNGDINYAFGFSPFAFFSPYNRKVNYQLAKELHKKISETPDEFNATFTLQAITEMRRPILQKVLWLSWWAHTSIRSDELNRIIEDARKLEG